MKLPERERFYSLRDSEKLRSYYTKAFEVFKDYQYITTPTLEVYEPFLSLKPFIIGTCPEGYPLSIRSDWTISVARFLSSYRNLKLPCKVFYMGNVFSMQEGEMQQVGVELLGFSDRASDAQVIRDIWTYLKFCGFENMVVNIGHARIVKKLLQDHKDHSTLFEAFLNKDFYTLKDYPDLCFLLRNQGRREFLQECIKLYPKVEKELEELLEMSEYLEGVDYVFDLSEVRTQEYYTGMVFEIFIEDFGYPIAGGGRYDNLYRDFGLEVDAVGGAVYLDRLLEKA